MPKQKTIKVKKVICNINIEIPAPNAKDEDEAIEVAKNYELPHGYVSDSFEIVKVVEDDEPENYEDTERQYKPFPITSICRADLEGEGYDTSDVEDSTMEALASKMANAYCDDGFWIDMPILAEALNIKKREGNKKE